MRTKSKKESFNKSLAGESGSSGCTPLHYPGIVSTDPAGVYYMEYLKEQRLHFIKIIAESINMRLGKLVLLSDNDYEDHLDKIEDLKNAIIFIMDFENSIE